MVNLTLYKMMKLEYTVLDHDLNINIVFFSYMQTTAVYQEGFIVNPVYPS